MMDQTKEVAFAVAKGIELFFAVKDGVGLGDIAEALAAVKAVPLAIDKIDQVPGELASAGQAGRDEVTQHFAVSFSISDKAVQAKIVNAFNVVVDVTQIFSLFKK